MKNIKFVLIAFTTSIIIAFFVGYMIGPHSEKKVEFEKEDPAQVSSKMIHHASSIPMDESKAPVITLSTTAQKLAQIEVSEVIRKEVIVSTPLYGTVDYDETKLAKVTTWVGGRIDELFVDYLGIKVEKGDPIAIIYSPELITAQSELIQSRKVLNELNESTLKYIKRSSDLTQYAAYKKLQLLGINNDQIEDIIDLGEPKDHLTLYAPISGTVIHLGIQEGMYVETGNNLFAIADLSQLWIICDAYESDLQWIQLGNEVDFTLEAFPGKKFFATVSYIDPFVNQKTRTIRVRLNVANPERLLKPGMFIQANQQTLIDKFDGERPLVIPISAPLLTGTRAVVYVESPEMAGEYEGRVIELGPKAGKYFIVKSGLEEGEKVVTNGNFKIDSAMQIEARPSMMSPAGKKNVIEENLPISYAE
ncbi:MAG: efflux RND transporter periplasmic adaptor subunit [Rhabdochlamydiaceae bacterium]|nr:efflux RND transporter periplasmic adaptor subunit [Candidatus Amphrikana amoebophyrae]